MSNDNKYLAVAEINTSGTLIQSNIKIISVEKAETDPTNSVVFTHNEESNKLITHIKYQDKDRLSVLYDDGINVIYEQSEEGKIAFKENKITFASIDLDNYLAYTIDKSTGLFNSSTQVIIKNTGTNKENVYTTRGNNKRYENICK